MAKSTKQGMTGRLVVRVDSDILGWLRKAAAKRRVPKSVIIREALLAQFEDRHAK